MLSWGSEVGERVLNIDLHNHSYYSDGELSPEELVNLAHQKGVDVLALTDHDNTAGLKQAAASAKQLGIIFIPGVEISASWLEQGVHIVGLNVDPDCPTLQQGLTKQLNVRGQRAQAIAAKLEQLGIENAYSAVQAIAGNGAIGRLHFAKLLLDRGCVTDLRGAFRRYLAERKPAYVPANWVDLAGAINWIKTAGGQAVLAHPGSYKLTLKQLRCLLQAFKAAGGVGLEVVTASYNSGKMQQMADLGQEFGLLASRGSDFHGPLTAKGKLGDLVPLPAICQPIWYDWHMIN